MASPTLIRRLRKKNVTITIEAHAGILLAPTQPIGSFSRKLTRDIETSAAALAPVNRRPRWLHYGKPLKESMKASTQTRLDQMKVHAAVGSTAHYALFVDQGTNDFMAKILPPWSHGSPSLYEHTWKVPRVVGHDATGHKIVEFEELGRIHVSGQEARYFMDRAVAQAFAFRRMQRRKSSVPGTLSEAKNGFPPTLANFIGATPWDMRFDTQLREWRIWRDAAWERRGILGEYGAADRERARRRIFSARTRVRRNYYSGTPEENNRKRQQRFRDRNKDRINRDRRRARKQKQLAKDSQVRANQQRNDPTKPADPRLRRAIENDKLRLERIARLRYPSGGGYTRFAFRFDGDHWVVDIIRNGQVIGSLSSGKRFPETG